MIRVLRIFSEAQRPPEKCRLRPVCRFEFRCMGKVSDFRRESPFHCGSGRGTHVILVRSLVKVLPQRETTVVVESKPTADRVSLGSADVVV